MQVVLVMFRAEGERRSFSITRDITVVGRREDCDFRIPLGEISRKHCRLIKDGDVLRVEDLGSSNGTFQNGERVQMAELQPGDTLQIGSVVFVVQIDGTPTDDDMQPVTVGGRQTATPSDSAHPDSTLHQDDSTGDSAGNGANNEFDPMSILAAGNSGALPAIEDSQVGENMMIDLAGGSSAGGSADRA